MSGFVLHPEANTDLDEIWEYIAADNLVAADRVLKKSTKRFSGSSLFLARATAVLTSRLARCVFIPYETF